LTFFGALGSAVGVGVVALVGVCVKNRGSIRGLRVELTALRTEVERTRCAETPENAAAMFRRRTPPLGRRSRRSTSTPAAVHLRTQAGVEAIEMATLGEDTDLGSDADASAVVPVPPRRPPPPPPPAETAVVKVTGFDSAFVDGSQLVV
jgi:hypothetical protein